MTIEGRFNFPEDAGEETCTIDLDLTVTGDSSSGSISFDCEGIDGMGLPKTSIEIGTVTACAKWSPHKVPVPEKIRTQESFVLQAVAQTVVSPPTSSFS